MEICGPRIGDQVVGDVMVDNVIFGKGIVTFSDRAMTGCICLYQNDGHLTTADQWPLEGIQQDDGSILTFSRFGKQTLEVCSDKENYTVLGKLEDREPRILHRAQRSVGTALQWIFGPRVWEDIPSPHDLPPEELKHVRPFHMEQPGSVRINRFYKLQIMNGNDELDAMEWLWEEACVLYQLRDRIPKTDIVHSERHDHPYSTYDHVFYQAFMRRCDTIFAQLAVTLYQEMDDQLKINRCNMQSVLPKVGGYRVRDMAKEYLDALLQYHGQHEGEQAFCIPRNTNTKAGTELVDLLEEMQKRHVCVDQALRYGGMKQGRKMLMQVLTVSRDEYREDFFRGLLFPNEMDHPLTFSQMIQLFSAWRVFFGTVSSHSVFYGVLTPSQETEHIINMATLFRERQTRCENHVDWETNLYEAFRVLHEESQIL